MSDFSIKEGDTSPAIEYELQDGSGSAVDISGFNEVKFLMDNDGTLKVDDDTNGNVTVTDAANGKVKYDWQAADTDTAEYYEAEWEVTYGDGTVETFPNYRMIDIEVHRDLD